MCAVTSKAQDLLSGHNHPLVSFGRVRASTLQPPPRRSYSATPPCLNHNSTTRKLNCVSNTTAPLLSPKYRLSQKSHVPKATLPQNPARPRRHRVVQGQYLSLIMRMHEARSVLPPPIGYFPFVASLVSTLRLRPSRRRRHRATISTHTREQMTRAYLPIPVGAPRVRLPHSRHNTRNVHGNALAHRPLCRQTQHQLQRVTRLLESQVKEVKHPRRSLRRSLRSYSMIWRRIGQWVVARRVAGRHHCTPTAHYQLGVLREGAGWAV